jgi:hypothetical protein
MEKLKSSFVVVSFWNIAESGVKHLIVLKSLSQFRGVGQGMKQIYLYLWYPLFQAQFMCFQVFSSFW